MGETTEGSEENVELSWNYGEIKKTVNSWVKLRREVKKTVNSTLKLRKNQENGELMA